MAMNLRLYCLAIIVGALQLSGCTESARPPANTPAQSLAPVVFNRAGAPTVEFNAPDMMCAEGCGAKVNEILSEQPGAKEVLVDFENKKATVAIDRDANFDANAAIAALVDHGFKNSSIKSAAVPSEPAAPPAANESSSQ